jgi:hypothetical protein
LAYEASPAYNSFHRTSFLGPLTQRSPPSRRASRVDFSRGRTTIRPPRYTSLQQTLTISYHLGYARHSLRWSPVPVSSSSWYPGCCPAKDCCLGFPGLADSYSVPYDHLLCRPSTTNSTLPTLYRRPATAGWLPKKSSSRQVPDKLYPLTEVELANKILNPAKTRFESGRWHRETRIKQWSKRHGPSKKRNGSLDGRQEP